MFRYSICDPLQSEPIEMGDIQKERILHILDRFPWTDLLEKMNDAKECDVHFSPSLEFENKANRHGLCISIVEHGTGTEFYIFFQRPKIVTKLFGLMQSRYEKFTSDRTGQTSDDVRDAVTALINDDLATLEKRWG